MADIEFYHTKATEKQLDFKEIYYPIIEKQKKLLIHVKDHYISYLNNVP